MVLVSLFPRYFFLVSILYVLKYTCMHLENPNLTHLKRCPHQKGNDPSFIAGFYLHDVEGKGQNLDTLGN